MKRIALTLVACVWASLAFGQANGVSTFQTPGNQTVPGYVPLGLSFSGVAGGAASSNAGYPPGATPVNAVFSGANTTSAAATFGAQTGKVNYLCGFQLTGLGATAATIVTPTITGLESSNTFTYTGAFTFVAGAAAADTPFMVTFTPCLLGVTVGNTLSVTVPGAAGNTNFSINMWGYFQ